MALSQNAKNSIQSFDVNLSSVIQLNSSKVPAQEGVFSLIISAGGTGCDALLEAKGMINKTCCLNRDHKNLPTDHVAYLCFDTDTASLKKSSSQETGGASLDQQKGEFVQMSAPNIATFLSPAFRSQVPTYISSWLDFSINPNQTGDIGAGGIRQCGRLLLFQNVDKICEAISNAIRTMVADQKVDALNVYLLAGIGGGTGSGTFIDLAYMARQVAESVQPNKVTMYGYLFLPDVNLSLPLSEENKQYIRKNGYAALKELDYLMNMSNDGGKFVQRYSPSYVIDTNVAPFHYVHLVSGTGSNGQVLSDPYRHGMRAVAQSILSFVAEEKKDGVTTQFAMKSHYSNIEQATKQHVKKFPERGNGYLALGTFNYEIPIDQILLYVTSLLFEKMNGMFDCDPQQNDIDKAYAMLGLAPKSLISDLSGNRANLAPRDTNWESLFGGNVRYDLSAMCNGWLRQKELDVEMRSKTFLKEFPERFAKYSEGWFNDGEKGPVWVNHLIILNDEQHTGLVAKLSRDYAVAGGKITKLKTEIEKKAGELQGAASEARSAGAVFGDREGKTQRYVRLVNEFADLNVELYATVKAQDIFDQCKTIILDKNNKLYNVVVEVLEGLKDVCKNNADILTKTDLSADGTNFTWKPMRIPDVSRVIRKAFDAKGDAKQTIASFSEALLRHAYEWSEGQVDVRSFIREYLDTNLSDIANRSLEDYVTAALNGEDLHKSVVGTLAPKTHQMSVPLLARSTAADTGGDYMMLSVPYSCPNILSAFKAYRNSTPDIASHMTIQPSGINSRIFAQSLLSAVPLSAYAPMADLEKAYLGTSGNRGLHLYMGERENWQNLPCPIPYRSRPKMTGAYPEGIQKVEDEQRTLYKACRDLPIIRKETDGAQETYVLHISRMPDLDRQFSMDAMRDERGRLDATHLEDAVKTLEDWITNGLPDRELSDSVHENTYQIAVWAPSADQNEYIDSYNKAANDPELVAQECFLGEYNNLRRAREELEKYKTLQRKLDELKLLLKQTAGVVHNARRLISLLVSGVVKAARLEDGTPVYNYVNGENERLLVKIGRRMNWRELVLSNAFEALAEDAEPMKRELYKRLNAQAERNFRLMDSDKEKATEKHRKLQALEKGVTIRYERLRDDVMDGVADEGVDRETVAFYEKLLAQLKREERNVKDLLEELEFGGGAGGSDFDEF